MLSLSLPVTPDVAARLIAQIALRVLGGKGSGNFGHSGRKGEVGGARALGGPGSGNFGHGGRPGERGGSSPEPGDIDVRLGRNVTRVGDAEAQKSLDRAYGKSQSDLDHKGIARIVGSDSQYSSISRELRSGKPSDETKRIASQIDKQFEESSAVAAEDTDAYRGMRMTAGTFKPGTVFSDKAYPALSTSMNHAASFTTLTGRGGQTGGGERFLLHVTVSKGAKMIAPQLTTTYDGLKKNAEAQVLLPRGSRFKVLSVSKPGYAKAGAGFGGKMRGGRIVKEGGVKLRVVRVELL